ncbi:hypothetical protein ACIBFB_08865 [Nocardiopsis sp. NPDC050513]|uniref:hypothetical protein n=1 Tax=Nocardiopsis sp. NPDC050513 TaxID=3364338 RepID=UPI00379EFCC5
MTGTYADLLACEDLLLFAGAAMSSSGQHEFHPAAGRQRLSLDFLHAYVHQTLPDLYPATLALHVNDHNAALVIANLLARPRPDAPAHERARENALIRRRLALMPPQRVYRLFARLAARRVNNRRTRATMRAWIGARPDLALDALKYRSGLRTATRHARVRLPEEVAHFLFSRPVARRRHPYASPLLRAHSRAPRSVRDLADLRRAVEASRAASVRGHDELMLPSLTGGAYAFEHLYTRAGFTLSRFLPSFRGDRDHHIGEVVTAEDGRVAYLKTFRLSHSQVRRGSLLRALDGADWSLEDTARALGTDRSGLVTRMERADLAHLLNGALLDRHRAERGRRVGRYTP